MNEESDIRQRVGKQIAEMRQRKGLSQRQLAEISGVGNAHIARIELGKYNVRIDILDKLAEALGGKLEITE